MLPRKLFWLWTIIFIPCFLPTLTPPSSLLAPPRSWEGEVREYREVEDGRWRGWEAQFWLKFEHILQDWLFGLDRLASLLCFLQPLRLRLGRVGARNGFYIVAFSDRREQGHEGPVLGAEYLYIQFLEGILIPSLTIGCGPIVRSQPNIPNL